MTSSNQLRLFDESDGVQEAAAELRSLNERAIRIREELRIGQWDHDRLLPERQRYENTVKRWRGITDFKYPQNKFDALEARAIIRFIKEWKSRADNLTVELHEIEFLIQGKS